MAATWTAAPSRRRCPAPCCGSGAASRSTDAAPDRGRLRVALGRRLLEVGAPAEALRELELAVAAEPANADALDAAARAAEATGDAARAAAYRLAGRRGAPAREAAPAVPPVPASPARAEPEGDGAPRLRLVGPEETAEPDPRPPVTFADVGGLDEVKQRLNRSFLLPLRQPEVFARFGKSLRGGLLLYGPPGCGKTFIARALAGEIGARFISIGLPDVLDMRLGESERKLHELFENARRSAPAVLFLDEVDARLKKDKRSGRI